MRWCPFVGRIIVTQEEDKDYDEYTRTRHRVKANAARQVSAQLKSNIFNKTAKIICHLQRTAECSCSQRVLALEREGKWWGRGRLLKCWETAHLPLPSCPQTRCLCGASSFLLNCKSKCICKCISGLEDETYPLYPLRLHQHLVQATPAPLPLAHVTLLTLHNNWV